ncbi:hypothetical protein MP228_001017 [Amoeboaphelidium protococcarum]|nr:hypothetical protein MP228_001017 [Amoeboaphelidium protococcarum]
MKYIIAIQLLLKVSMAYVGELTYYDLTAGASVSCLSKGISVSAADLPAAVAVSFTRMNSDASCGKCVQVTGPSGTTIMAKVVDSCAGCAENDIDLSKEAFIKLAATSVGRLKNVKWSVVDCAGGASGGGGGGGGKMTEQSTSPERQASESTKRDTKLPSSTPLIGDSKKTQDTKLSGNMTSTSGDNSNKTLECDPADSNSTNCTFAFDVPQLNLSDTERKNDTITGGPRGKNGIMSSGIAVGIGGCVQILSLMLFAFL